MPQRRRIAIAAAFLAVVAVPVLVAIAATVAVAAAVSWVVGRRAAMASPALGAPVMGGDRDVNGAAAARSPP
jgi:hypothetical protein